eukprot:TRINITY_DN8785_c0_g1_i1.p1 TRINITY_DN8785_c0_g1~~TRINITY_DN8785_c0_g1_i1.p1  ORF type:complete len:282 (+),score=72.09 TRINITY_DN8785_c0_g1_i1:84-848(+)
MTDCVGARWLVQEERKVEKTAMDVLQSVVDKAVAQVKKDMKAEIEDGCFTLKGELMQIINMKARESDKHIRQVGQELDRMTLSASASGLSAKGQDGMEALNKRLADMENTVARHTAKMAKFSAQEKSAAGPSAPYLSFVPHLLYSGSPANEAGANEAGAYEAGANEAGANEAGAAEDVFASLVARIDDAEKRLEEVSRQKQTVEKNSATLGMHAEAQDHMYQYLVLMERRLSALDGGTRGAKSTPAASQAAANR